MSEPEWIVNSLGELGIKLGDRFLFLYKGDSLEYKDGKHDDGTPMLWRRVGKREFGEVCYPAAVWKSGVAPKRYTAELAKNPGLDHPHPEGFYDWAPLPEQQPTYTPQQIVQAGLQHNKAQPDDHVVTTLLSLSNKADDERKATDNPSQERIRLGMREAYEHAARIVRQHQQSDAAFSKSALYALQCVKAFCSAEIDGLIVPGESRTLEKIVDQAIEGLTSAKPPRPQFLELGGNEIDLRRVVSIGPTGGDPEWLRYTAFFYGDGSHHLEIYERRRHAGGHPLPQMPRDEFIKLWKAANQ